MLSFYGTKLTTTSAYDQKGNRLAVTLVKVKPLIVTQVKTESKDGYWSIQCAILTKSSKSLSKPLKNHLKKALPNKAPLFLREIKLSKEPKLKPGEKILVTDVISVGDQVKVTGTTKGRGFAGVIKRWGFHGGPRTHGQSDRERAIGSIGQRTDPGRVWKGKKMPGHFGTDTKTVRGLEVIAIDKEKNQLIVTGTAPGHRNSLLIITKTGVAKKPILLKDRGSATSATLRVATAPAASSEPIKKSPVKKSKTKKPVDKKHVAAKGEDTQITKSKK